MVHDFVKDLIAHAGRGAIVRIAGSIANQDVDGAPNFACFLQHVLQLLFAGNAGADGHGCAAFCLNFFHNRLTGIQFPARDHHFGACACQLKSNGSPNASACACHDGHFVFQIE